ncbi:MAG: ribosome silencing factor [Spirochaetota bacterium]|jgi:ribosome-associated protein|nr:ribosome silencing factor [Spirochaetota bacterium]
MHNKTEYDKPDMQDTLELVVSVAKLLDEKQANNILILDISFITPMTDFFVIADTETQIQLDALRAHIEDMLAARRIALRSARAPQTSWALLDYNGFVVHLFLREAREFYGLERIWREGKIITP